MGDKPAGNNHTTDTPTFFELQIQIAYAAGFDAASRDASRAPVHSKVVMGMLAGPSALSPREFNAACRAFQLGYQAHCDQEAEKVLQSDD